MEENDDNDDDDDHQSRFLEAPVVRMLRMRSASLKSCSHRLNSDRSSYFIFNRLGRLIQQVEKNRGEQL